MDNLSEEVVVATKGFNSVQVRREEIIRWLAIVYKMSGSKELQNAIMLAKHHQPKTDEERDIIGTVTTLYRAQCSGTLFPPISIGLLYEEVVDSIKNESA